MPVSPADFALWARATGNKYPETAEEKLAAAPHAYTFAKNIGKAGEHAPGGRVGGSIFYDQPQSVQETNPDSLFNAPVTPDNRVPKVAGTVTPSLTSEHFLNQEKDEAEDRAEQSSLLHNIGRAGLAVGALATGVALAQNPGVQQAVRSAGTTLKENATDIGSRVSHFLGGFGGGRYSDPDVIRNSGDVTPPTTGQRYQQEQVPSATQTIQVAKGAPTGSAAESLLQTKPVTESEIITSSQTFGPGMSAVPDPWTGQATPLVPSKSPAASFLALKTKQLSDPWSTGTFEPASEGGSYALSQLERTQPASPEVKAARAHAATEQLLSAARAHRGETYQREIPGIGGTLMALRSPLAGVDLSDPSLGLVQPSAETPVGMSTKAPGQLELNLSEQTSDMIPAGHARVAGAQTVVELPSVTEAPKEFPAPRQRTQRLRDIPVEHQKAYSIVAAGAERGEKIPFERALEIATNPEAVLSHGEQQAFEWHEPVALRGQSFGPGKTTTGQTRGTRTGEQGKQRAEELLERYTRENVAGLTPGVRRSAGAQRLRGVPEQDEPTSVLSTPTGRTMRGISALSKEALAEGREEYAPWTEQVAGTTDPEQLAKTVASATSQTRMNQLNSLFGPESSAIMLHVRTEGGLQPVATKALNRSFGDAARNIFHRAANYYAGAQGIELPDQSDPQYHQAATNVLYGNKDVSREAVKKMGAAFDSELRSRGIKLAATSNPYERNYEAAHELMNISRGSTTSHLGLQHFTTMAGRLRSQGLMRSAEAQVPVNIPIRPPGV